MKESDQAYRQYTGEMNQEVDSDAKMLHVNDMSRGREKRKQTLATDIGD